jgi:hypothetical protein
MPCAPALVIQAKASVKLKFTPAATYERSKRPTNEVGRLLAVPPRPLPLRCRLPTLLALPPSAAHCLAACLSLQAVLLRHPGLAVHSLCSLCTHSRCLHSSLSRMHMHAPQGSGFPSALPADVASVPALHLRGRMQGRLPLLWQCKLLREVLRLRCDQVPQPLPGLRLQVRQHGEEPLLLLT